MRPIHRILLALTGLLTWEGSVAQTATNTCSYSGGNQYSVGTSCNPTAFDKPGSFTATYNPGGCNSGNNDDAWGWFTATSTTTNIT